MSESTFPFGGTDEPEAVAVDTQDEDGGRKPLLVIGGLVGALALGAGAFVLLGGGGADDAELDLAVPTRSAPDAAAPQQEAVAIIPAASADAVGRNPFKARYIAPVEAPAAAETATVDPAALPLPQQPVQITLAAPAPAPATAPAEQAPAQYKLTLKAISEPQPEARTVTWEYEGKEAKVLPGQRFGKYGELVVLAFTANEDGTQVTGAILQVGDAAPFDAKLGQTYDVL